MNTVVSRRKEFLTYIKEHFSPSIIYYPFPGDDSVPMEVFGADHITNSPPTNENVDMVLNYPAIPGKELQLELRSVLKPGGIVTIEGAGYIYSDRSKWNECYSQFKDFKIVKLPDDFRTGQNVYGVTKDNRPSSEGWYVASEQEMIDYVTRHKGYSGFNEILDYVVFQKP